MTNLPKNFLKEYKINHRIDEKGDFYEFEEIFVNQDSIERIERDHELRQIFDKSPEKFPKGLTKNLEFARLHLMSGKEITVVNL